MYRTSYQSGMLTIFFSCGAKPLEIWDVVLKDGYIKTFLDQEIKSMVLDIRGNNVSTTYMICPSKRRILGISMPFLIMVVKNLKKYFSFEVTILDETGTRRRFRVANFQSTTQIMPMCTAMPIGLTDGWNQIQFNLAEFTRRAYNKQFVEVQQLKINANIRLRRIYFTQRLVPDDELPAEYKLFFPLAKKNDKPKKLKEDKENIQPANKIEPVDIKKDNEITVIKTNSRQSLHSNRGSKVVLPTVMDAVESTAGAGQDSVAPGEPNASGEGTPFEFGGENTIASAVTEAASLTEAVVVTPANIGEGPPAETVEEPLAGTVEEPLEETVEEPLAETVYEPQDQTVEEPATTEEPPV